jgi:uncharacterized membrane protein
MGPSAAKLDELPTKNGFRLRGLDMTRIETFTDAAFAFALTLLVVSLDIPTSFEELTASLHGIPAFALSAVLLMLFWNGHNEWSRRYGLDDAMTVILSCLLVFTVLVYVYPLKFVFQSMLVWLNRGLGLPVPFEEITLRSPAQVNQLFVIYSAGFIAMCASIILLNLHAWRLRETLHLNELERFDTKAEIGAWLIVGGAGVLSIIVALALPPSLAGLPGFAYMLLAFVMPVYGMVGGRRRRAIAARSG